MVLYLTKLFWLVASPLSLVLIALFVALLLSFTRWRKTLRMLLGLALGGFGFLCCTNIGEVMIRPLETRFARPAEPARIDGIIVLGGAMDMQVNSQRHGWELNQYGDRFVEALRLAQRHPEAKVLISGGVAIGAAGTEEEALAGARFFADFGIAPDRIVIESASRNTEENAQFTRDRAAPKPGDTWLLVTSAFHMPRSEGLFRKAGFDVTPWPTDYQATAAGGLEFRPTTAIDNLTVANVAIREWAGLLGYWVAGKIDALLPGP